MVSIFLFPKQLHICQVRIIVAHLSFKNQLYEKKTKEQEFYTVINIFLSKKNLKFLVLRFFFFFMKA